MAASAALCRAYTLLIKCFERHETEQRSVREEMKIKKGRRCAIQFLIKQHSWRASLDTSDVSCGIASFRAFYTECSETPV